MKSYYQQKFIEAGCDEAGRGCLAGPVFAAAVILPKNFKNDIINDSKKLTEKQRLALKLIIEQEAIAYAVQKVSPKQIDRINILQASFLAMHKAIDKLPTIPQLLLIDGNRFASYKNIAHNCIIKGDAKYASIAAASILAKTYRDVYMKRLHKKFPQYNWQQNKGYPTIKHRLAVIEHGPSIHHRKTFSVTKPKQLLMLKN